MQNIKLRLIKAFALTVCITAVSGFLLGNASYAKTAKEIDASVDTSLDRFRKEVRGAEEFLKSAKGVLVLPGVIKGGLIIGGEYGEGALRIDGKPLIIIASQPAHTASKSGAKRKTSSLSSCKTRPLRSSVKVPAGRPELTGR
ncbi:hypothetical protein DOJK_02305 [Patescibacteria group bacterium]|nr:hypothetical protein DOJK_02305 [Patescibacteria group bacterium]